MNILEGEAVFPRLNHVVLEKLWCFQPTPRVRECGT